MNRSISISVVIPAFDEQERLGATLERIAAFLQAQDDPHEIVVIDDGSSDQTARIAREFSQRSSSPIQVYSNACNRGKGYSVRRGMLLCRGRYGLLSDADLSTPIQELVKLRQRLEQDGLAIVFGSRDAQGAQVEVRQPFWREGSGKAFNKLMRSITGLPFTDTQCGFKLFDLQQARFLFELQRIDGFGFDVELLYLARKYGLAIREVPVVWRNAGGSKVGLFSGLAAIRDLFLIRRNDRSNLYDMPRPTGEAD